MIYKKIIMVWGGGVDKGVIVQIRLNEGGGGGGGGSYGT